MDFAVANHSHLSGVTDGMFFAPLSNDCSANI